MVAIVTDTHTAPVPYLADPYPTTRVPAARRPRPAAGGQPAAPGSTLARAAVVVVALLALLLAAMGTAAVGRVLDAQRGVPATVDATQVGSAP